MGKLKLHELRQFPSSKKPQDKSGATMPDMSAFPWSYHCAELDLIFRGRTAKECEDKHKAFLRSRK